MALRSLATVVALLLSACATTILPVAQLTPSPSARVTWKDSIAADAGVRMAGIGVVVAVDGVRAGEIYKDEIYEGEVLKLRVDAGRKVVSVSTKSSRPRSVEVIVGSGHTTLLRIGLAKDNAIALSEQGAVALGL
jgi:phosphosulfolactate phosphohydrolase-like enzyme